MKRSGRPNPVSERRLAERELRDEVVTFVRKRDRYRCQAGPVHDFTNTRCSGPLDVHEVVSRAQWAKGYLEPDNCVLICRGAHDWVTSHPEDAHTLGFIKWSWEREDA